MNLDVKKKISTLAELRSNHLNVIPHGYVRRLFDEHLSSNVFMKFYQIKNNQLYLTYEDPFPEYETRIAGSNLHLLSVLKNHEIPDMEFIYCDDDSLNTDLPIFVPGCSAGRSQLLVPDFMFRINPECHLNDHDSDMKSIFLEADKTGKTYEDWLQREDKIVYRGSLNNVYRGSYGALDGWQGVCDFKHINCYHAPRGLPNYMPGITPHAMTREEKTRFKFLLHLNGHEDTAISGAFRYALACKSLVFYGTSSPYQEWWQHESIFKENAHYVRANSPSHLLQILPYFLQNSKEAFEFASRSFEFAKDFLVGEPTEFYYASLLKEYAKRNSNEFDLHPKAKKITSYKKRLSENEVIEITP